MSETRPKKSNSNAIVKMYADLTPRMITYASRDVIKAWVAFRLNSANGGDSRGTMLLFENVLTAMRKDLGHSTRFQQPGELLKLWINDVDTAILKQPVERP